MGATLSSVPLCSRADPATDDNNNVDTLTDNNLDVREVNANMIVAHQPAPAPVETSTPKIDREREIERDLGESDNPDSLEFGPTSDKTFGSDSGLDHSSDEQEMSRYNIDDDYLDTVLDTEDEDEEEVDPEVDDETQESLESGDLGIDRSTTFRVKKKDEDEEQVKEEFNLDKTDEFLRKLDDLESVQQAAVTSRLSELDIRDSPSSRN